MNMASDKTHESPNAGASSLRVTVARDLPLGAAHANRARSLRRFVDRTRGRLHADFRLSIITLCSVFSVIGIMPFAIYRIAVGQLLAGLVDLALIACISSATIHAWVTGRTRGAGLLLVVTNSVGCFVVGVTVGTSGVLWAYAVVLMNFFLAERRPAMLASSMLIASFLFHGGNFATTAESTAFAVTATLVSLYAFVFASRTEHQRQQLETLASMDPLTGAGNRRSMERDLATATRDVDPSRPPCAVVILDLDHFKKVNDLHGHEAGDRVLVDFVAILRNQLRRGDRLYRYGGEEFVVLLTDTDIQGVNAVVTKLRHQIHQLLLSPGGRITVSMGVALWQMGEDWSSTLGRADAALFMAKRNGRDCVMWDRVPEVLGRLTAANDPTVQRFERMA
jgi:diguanylate cyclase (GGDEF)-like protein